MLKSWCRIFRGSHLIGGNISTYRKSDFEFTVDATIHGYHHYKTVWAAVTGRSYKWPNGSVYNLLIYCNSSIATLKQSVILTSIWDATNNCQRSCRYFQRYEHCLSSRGSHIWRVALNRGLTICSFSIDFFCNKFSSQFKAKIVKSLQDGNKQHLYQLHKGYCCSMFVSK